MDSGIVAIVWLAVLWIVVYVYDTARNDIYMNVMQASADADNALMILCKIERGCLCDVNLFLNPLPYLSRQKGRADWYSVDWYEFCAELIIGEAYMRLHGAAVEDNTSAILGKTLKGTDTGS